MTETIKTDNTQALYNALSRIRELERTLEARNNWIFEAKQKLDIYEKQLEEANKVKDEARNVITDIATGACVKRGEYSRDVAEQWLAKHGGRGWF